LIEDFRLNFAGPFIASWRPQSLPEGIRYEIVLNQDISKLYYGPIYSHLMDEVKSLNKESRNAGKRS